MYKVFYCWFLQFNCINYELLMNYNLKKINTLRQNFNTRFKTPNENILKFLPVLFPVEFFQLFIMVCLFKTCDSKNT